MADVGLGEPAGEVIQRVVEGAEHDHLLAAFEDLGDEGQDGGGLGDVGGAGTRRQRNGSRGPCRSGSAASGLAPTRAHSQVSAGSPGWATRCPLEGSAAAMRRA